MQDLTSLSALIIDDISTVRGFLKQILQYYGIIHIAEAANGLDGVNYYQDHHPQIVFLDLGLPDIAGNEVLKQIKQVEKNAYVVIVSAHSSVDLVRESVRFGASGFIVKPFSPKKIGSVLTRYSDKMLG